MTDMNLPHDTGGSLQNELNDLGLPAVSDWPHRAFGTFREAIAHGALEDHSVVAQSNGLTTRLLMTRELIADITVHRFPGEMGGFTPEDRLKIVVAMAASLIVTSDDTVPPLMEGKTFADAVGSGLDSQWTVRLPLLVEPRPQYTRPFASDPRVSYVGRTTTDFQPYALCVSLEHDSQNDYALVCTLQTPFARHAK